MQTSQDANDVGILAEGTGMIVAETLTVEANRLAFNVLWATL